MVLPAAVVKSSKGTPFQGIYSNTPPNAPIYPYYSRKFRVTHPFHPLKGRFFEFVELRSVLRKDCLYFYDTEGRLRLIPAAWTDFVERDAFLVISKGRSFLHVEYAIRLAALIEDLQDAQERNV